MRPTRLLLLAGTSEASQLAQLLEAEPGIEVVASFAGRTRAPAMFPCPTRAGGFGGVDGLVGELRRGAYDLLVDATHPFAACMPGHAADAANIAGIPRLRLLRPGWRPGPGDRWDEVETLDAAASRLEEVGARRVLLTTGRHELMPFAGLMDTHFVVRSIDPPGPLPLADALSIVARPPFSVETETELLSSHRIDTIVTKNSGGDRAKLVAARKARVAIVMVRRPAGVAGPRVTTAPDALRWVRLTAPSQPPRSMVADAHHDIAAAGGGTEGDALARLGTGRVQRILAGLAPDQADVLALQVIADLSVDQIAAALGKSPGP